MKEKLRASAFYNWYMVQTVISSILISVLSIQREKCDNTGEYVAVIIMFAIGLFLVIKSISENFLEIDNQRNLRTSIIRGRIKRKNNKAA